MKTKTCVDAEVKESGVIQRYFVLIATLLGFLPLLGTALFYYKHFHCELGLPLANDNSSWGTFGDFIGGITNPIYAYLAFAGVVYALILQKDQTDMMRQHRKLEDIGGILESISSSINSALFEKQVRVKGKDCSVNDALLDISDLSITAELDPHGPAAMVYEDERTSVTVPIGYHLVYIQEQLELLAECHNMYLANGGPVEIGRLYRYRYKRVAFMMHQIKYLFLPEVSKFFNVEEEKKAVLEAVRNQR